MPEVISQFSYWFALILAVGSLFFYLSSALWNRLLVKEIDDHIVDFNLGLPRMDKPEDTFAIALVAAGTSLSTVFVFFLTASPIYGLWIMLSPVMFAVGNYVMFIVYKRINEKGYFTERTTKEHGVSGLVPYIAKLVSGSNTVGWLILLLSLLNLLAVLALELVVGVEVFGYLAGHTFNVEASSFGDVTIYTISVALLLGYVFIGGFRAVIASDVWQMKAMKWATAIAVVSVIIKGLSEGHSHTTVGSILVTPPAIGLWGFIVNVVLANLLSPMSQESSWQRFRAFSVSTKMQISKAINLSIVTSVMLWSGLILLSFGLLILTPSDAHVKLNSLPTILEALRSVNDWWFPLFIFPIMTVAALSAMYSTADTCVSSLLYLIEYSRSVNKADRQASPKKLTLGYYLSMVGIFLAALGAYAFVRVLYNPTILQLVFSVFSNLVVIAPTVFVATILPPAIATTPKIRSCCIAASISLGFCAYWASSISAIVLGQDYLWLSQLSIAIGLTGAVLPVVPLLFWGKSQLGLENHHG